MKIIAIVNQKGGTGKTTTTVNVGSALAAKRKKVLLVDLDPQGSLSYSLGILNADHTLADLFTGDAQLPHVMVSRENIIVLPANISLADIELSLADADQREYRLKHILEQAGKYDYVLIDCPPSLSMLTINALSAATHVIIPMQMEVLALQGLDLITDTIHKVKKAYNPGLQIAGILPVMIDSRRKLSREVYEHITTNYDIPVFDATVRNNVKASEAPSFGKSVLQYAPSSGSAIDYQAFAKELIQKIN